MIIELVNINKIFMGHKVLKNIGLTVEADDKIGIVGINGIGKTTLLNIIAGELDYDVDPANGESAVYIRRNTVIGYLRQVDVLSNAQRNFDDVKIRKMLNIMGLSDGDIDELDRRSDSLSSGEKTKFALAMLLSASPDVLLLDEPTNHLDFETRTWLEDYLSAFRGCIITVSHDRYFLDRLCNRICEMRDGKLYNYKGGYSDFVSQRNFQKQNEERAYEKQLAKTEKLEAFVRKNIAATASINSVGSRIKALEKMEPPKKTITDPKDVALKFDSGTSSGKDVLLVKNLSITYENTPLFTNGYLDIKKGDRVAIIGRNGIGKTSLLKALLNQIPYEGKIVWGGGVNIAYFDQECKSLNFERTAYDEVTYSLTGSTEFDVKSLLAKVNIVGDDVYKRVGELSGATKSKLAFALMMTGNANVLILDEPTNHLDYKAMEALEKALCNYGGTVIMVSHDRFLLNKIPDIIIEITDDGFIRYEGNYDFYLKNRRQKQKEAPLKPKSSYTYDRKTEKKRRADAAAFERKINLLESEISQKRELLASDKVVSDYSMILELTKQIEDMQFELDGLCEEWIKITDE